jgi:hypothetical protein
LIDTIKKVSGVLMKKKYLVIVLLILLLWITGYSYAQEAGDVNNGGSVDIMTGPPMTSQMIIPLIHHTHHLMCLRGLLSIRAEHWYGVLPHNNIE